MTFGIEKQILWFDVPVSDTLTMNIGNSMEYLLEGAFGLTGTHASKKRVSTQLHERGEYDMG